MNLQTFKNLGVHRYHIDCAGGRSRTRYVTKDGLGKGRGVYRFPYPCIGRIVPTYATHEKRQRKKSLSEIVRQVEKEKLQAELDRVKKLATA